MAPGTDFALKSRRVSTTRGEKIAAIVVSGGVIRNIVPPEHLPHGLPVTDAGDHLVMPGLFDAHVHLNDPGRAEWEGFASGTRAAAAGGVSALMDMPLNSKPVTTSLAAFEAKRAAAEGKLAVDCGFWGGVVPGNAAELGPMLDAGVSGFKAFLCHSGIEDFLSCSAEDLRPAMKLLAERGAPLLAHAEIIDHDIAPRGNPGAYATYLSSRPKAWEYDAAALLIALCRETGCRTHIVHVSSAEILPLLAAAKEEGLPITAETCPHYLTFASEEVPDGRTEFKCAPPIREAANREKLWDALAEGTLDFIASDHSPCTAALKRLDEGDFMKAWGGIAGLQFTLPAVWTAAAERGFECEDLELWLSEKPARFAGFGKRKGKIAPGYDADFVVWDPDAEFQVTLESVRHRNKPTPYLGRSLRGAVQKTYVRGRLAFDRGAFAEPPAGAELLNSKPAAAR